MSTLPENPNPVCRDALARLVDGNQRFATRARRVPERAELDAMFRRNGEGQKAWAAVLTCADSRLAPEIIFDTLLGEIFSVREAGNMAASKTTLGSLEFASAILEVPLLLVLGHRDCGAITAAFERRTATGHLATLIDAITPSVAGATDLDAAIKANVHASLRTIRKKSHALSSAEAAGNLTILGAIYDPATGTIAFLPV
ncbi:MAG: carbonic anhydrase [bacterium]